jgi:nitroimidazol reductase NimA-like FMN-containing flavoprotein (pyridoxamine 5'-phosphate oxidase superfamily)
MAAELTSVTQGIPIEVVEHLQRHHVITLSTTSFTGMPHADTVVYTNDDHSIYFFAGPGSYLLRNINDSKRISFTVDDYTVDWRKLRELQGVGRCRPVAATEEAAVWRRYQAKFGPDAVRPPGAIQAITPSEMHFVDYDYAKLTGLSSQIRRTFQIDDAPAPPAHGAVSTNLDRLTYEAGEVIFRPGNSIGEYYVVIEGEIEIRAEGYGADQTVIRLGPGQFFGDQAVLRGQKGALTCHAVTRTILLAVHRTALRELLQQQPPGQG